MSALASPRGHVRAEDLGQQAGHGVGVEGVRVVGIVSGHVKLLMVDALRGPGWRQAQATRFSPTDSTSGVGPHTKVIGSSRGRPGVLEHRRSMRRGSPSNRPAVCGSACGRRVARAGPRQLVQLRAVDDVLGRSRAEQQGAGELPGLAARWRTIAMSGTTPEPPATSRVGSAAAVPHEVATDRARAPRSLSPTTSRRA